VIVAGMSVIILEIITIIIITTGHSGE